MWFLIEEPDEGLEQDQIINLSSRTPKYALLPGEVYTVGRVRAADIVPSDRDDTVSGRHAKITVVLKKEPEVMVEDQKSNYGTYIDEAIDNPSIGIEAFKRGVPGKGITKPTILKNNSRIKFGALSFILRLVWIPLDVITSMLSDIKELKANLKDIGKFLVQPRWTERTTHLVMSNIQLSPKVLSCLVNLVPIVTPQYFKDFLSSMKTKQRLPDTDNYIPPISEAESQLKDPLIKLGVDATRKTFLQGKEFLFLDNSSLDLERVLPGTGAKVSHLDPDTQPDDPKFNSDDLLVVKPRSVDRQFQNTVTALLDHLKSIQRISVSSTTIFLAIMRVEASVCINKKQRGGRLLSTSASSSMASSSNIIAKETQHSHIASTPWTLESSNQVDSNLEKIHSKQNINMKSKDQGKTTSTITVAETISSSANQRLTQASANGKPTESMIPPTNRNIESFLPPTSSTVTNPSTNKSKAQYQPTNRSQYSQVQESAGSQKKRPLSLDSDSENQENKRPNQAINPTKPVPKQVTNKPEFISPKPVSTNTKLNSYTADLDDQSWDDDDDLFGFEEDALTPVVQSSGKGVVNSTVCTQGVSALSSRLQSATGLSTIKKRKAADLLSDEDDVFGFGDADDEAASKLTAALPTAKNPSKRLKDAEEFSQVNSTDSNYSPLPKMSAVKKESGENPRTKRHSSSAVNGSSFVDNTTGFLKKTHIKLEDEDNMSHLADEFCTILVSNLIRDDKDMSSRSGYSDKSGASSQNQSDIFSQGNKTFQKQAVPRLAEAHKVPLVKSLIGDEHDRSVADWLIQNQDVTQAIQDEEREKESTESFWKFDTQSQRSSANKLPTRVR